VRALLTLALVAGGLWAQGPAATVEVVADEDQVIVGQGLRLRAVVRDTQGNVRQGDNLVWAVDNRAIAEINAQSGELRAVGLGIAIVSASVGGIRGEAPVQTMPREVRIEPRTADLEVGQNLQFRATALDVNGAAIPVTWTWQVFNKNGGGTTLATITNTGLVRGVYEGGITVRATYTYNRTVFGMQRQWLMSAPVNVAVPRAFELTKMGGQRMQRGFELRARPSMVWGNEDGSDLFFNASLGGLANGLVNLSGEGMRLVGTAGTTRFTSGSFATDYRVHSVTASGRIMTLEATNGAGVQVNWGDKHGVVPMLANTAPLAGTENGNSFLLTRNSFTSSGWVLVRASYRVPGSNPVVNGVGLFRGYGDRLTELLVSNLEPVAGLTGALSIDGDFGITDDGVAYYTVSQGANRILFRHHNERQQLLRTGEAMLDSTVRSFLGGGGNRPTFFVGEKGDLLYGVVLNNNAQYFARHVAGAAVPQTLRLNSQAGFLWHHPEQGTLLYGNPLNSRGNGIHVWAKDGTVRNVLLLNGTHFGQTVQDVESGFLDSNGSASLMMRMNVANMMIARFPAAGESWVLAQHGEFVPVEAPINMLNILGGGRVGPLHLQTGGEAGSITQAVENDFLALVPVGARLFGTQMWFGGAGGTSSYTIRKSPEGDVFFTTGLGLGRLKAGQGEPDLFLRFNLPMPGVANQNIFAPFRVDANSRGEVLWAASTSLGDNRLYITSPDGQTHTPVIIWSAAAATATTIEGRIAEAVDAHAIDDTGRVMMTVRFRGRTNATTVLYENGRHMILAEANVSQIGGKPIAGVSNFYRAAGNRLFAGFSIVGGNQIFCEWLNGAWKVVLDNTERLMHGQVINTVSQFDVNRNGDMVFLHSAGTPYLVVRRADGRTQMVFNQFKPTPAGEYIIRILNVDLRDDGTVYFLGVNASDEQVIYQARPL